jgi:integrase
LPSVLVAVVREHLAEFPPSDPKDLIFKGPMGAALRRNNFHRSARWPECVAEAGLPQGFRFHDLRHTGNTLAASSGGEHTGADASDGAREYARRIDLSARHQQAGSRDCGCD